MSEEMKLKREATIRKALVDLNWDGRVDDCTWVVNGKKIRQTRNEDFWLPNSPRYGRFQTLDACLLFILCQMYDPAYTVPAPKYEQESCEYRCMDVEDALQAEIKAIETMGDYGDALQVAIALEAKIDRLVLETWMPPQTGESYKTGRIRSALNKCCSSYYSDEAKEERALKAVEAIAAFFRWAVTPAPAPIGTTAPVGTEKETDSMQEAKPTRPTTWTAYSKRSDGTYREELDGPIADNKESAKEFITRALKGRPGGRHEAYVKWEAGGFITVPAGDRPEKHDPAAPEPIIEVDPAGDVTLVGFETEGLPNADQIRAGIQMLAKTPEGPEKQQLLAEPLDPVEEEKRVRQTLLVDLKDAGVTAYLLAVAMMQTEVQIHMNPVPNGAQAPADHQRTVLKRIAEFARLAEGCVEEESQRMQDFALAYALNATIRICNGGDRPADSYVAAGILGRLLQHLTGQSASSLLGDYSRFGDPEGHMFRPLTKQERRLFEAYRRQNEVAVLENLREDR